MLNQNDPNRGGENWHYFQYILKSTEYSERLYLGSKRKRVKNNFKVWGLSKSKESVTTYRNGKD